MKKLLVLVFCSDWKTEKSEGRFFYSTLLLSSTYLCIHNTNYPREHVKAINWKKKYQKC